MHTARPTEEVEARVLAEGGNLESYRTEGYLSGPITDTLSGRIAGYLAHRGAYLDNSEGPDGGGTDTEAWRGSLAWDPSESVSVFFKYDHMNHRNNGIYDQLLADPFGITTNPFGSYAAAGITNVDFRKDRKQQVGGGGGINLIEDSVGGYYVSDVMALHASWEMANGYSLRSITGYNNYDARSRDYITASPIDALTINGLTEGTKYWSQELRIESPTDGAFSFIAGAFIDNYDMETLPRDNQYAALNLGTQVLPNFVRNLATTPALGFLGPLQRNVAFGFANGVAESFRLSTPSGSPDGTVSNLEQQIDTWSAFFEGSYQISEKWRLTAGVRYTDENNEVFMAKGTFYVNGDGLPWGSFPTASQITAAAVAADPALAALPAFLLDIIYGSTANAPIGGGLQVNDLPLLIAAPGGTPRINDEISEDAWIPSAKLQYFHDDDTMLYLTVSSGFKAGGYNSSGITAFNPTNDSFESETALALELGAKMTVLDGAGQLNVALYRTKFDDLQVASITPQGAIAMLNAASAITQGLELDFSWRATEELTLGMNYAYLDAYYDDSDAIGCGGYQKRVRELAGESFAASPCVFFLDDQPSGSKDLQRAPEHTGTLW
ncbi:MAG: TonB-dependent receptor, partial [Gammaproteobacteria bacterium]